MTSYISEARKKYESFHGNAPHSISSQNIIFPKVLVKLAEPEYITYKSDKLNGGGNGRMEYFKHRFHSSTKLYASPDGKMLIIIGPNLQVTKRGIVG